MSKKIEVNAGIDDTFKERLSDVLHAVREAKTPKELSAAVADLDAIVDELVASVNAKLPVETPKNTPNPV